MRQKKYYKLIRVDYEDSAYPRIKNVSNEVGEFSIRSIVQSLNGTLEYSTDGVNWNTYNLTDKPGISVNPNSNLYLRGTNFGSGYFSLQSTGIMYFSKSFIIAGNLLGIKNYQTMASATSIDFGQAFPFFRYNANLIDASGAHFGNATTIANQGLYYTFQGCTSLTTAPDLSNVTSIGNSGLSYCFKDCTSLTTAPDLSNVTSIGDNGLSYCFTSCASLTTTLDLSNATSVGNYGLQQAYSLCSNISTVTAPNIQNITTSILDNWLFGAGTSATGTKTVRVPTGATITTGSDSGIPTGWTRVDY